MAELDELADENIMKIEAKITFFFGSRKINLSFNGLAYNTRKDFAHC